MYTKKEDYKKLINFIDGTDTYFHISFRNFLRNRIYYANMHGDVLLGINVFLIIAPPDKLYNKIVKL